MKKKLITIVCAWMLIATLSGCSKSETVTTEPAASYFPLEVGRYITYQLDSIRLKAFGLGFDTIHYQAKDVVEAAIKDAAERNSFRVVRYLRKGDGTGEWKAISTILVTPLEHAIETSENNLRFRKIQLPIRDNFSWKGNGYIDTYSAASKLKYLDNWDYIYEMVNSAYETPMKTVENSITINQRDEEIGLEADITAYFEKNYSVEVYGKGIGLIYKEFVHKEFQPGSNQFVDGSYGIRLRMIDHN